MARFIDSANHITFLDVFIFQPFNFYFDIFPSFSVINALFSRVQNLGDLEIFLMRHQLDMVIHFNASLFDFSCQKETLVSDLIQHGHTERSIRISVRHTQIIQHFEEILSLIPFSLLIRSRFSHIVTIKSSNRDPRDLFISIIASFSQERLQTVNDLHITISAPVTIVHLIDQNNQMSNSDTLGQ